MAKKKTRRRGKRKIPIIPTALFIFGVKFLVEAWKKSPAHAFQSITGLNADFAFNWRDAKAGLSFLSAAVSNKIIASSGIRKGLNIPWFTV